MEVEWLESSLAERDLELLVNNRLSMKSVSLAAERANHILGCTKQHHHLINRYDFPVAFSFNEASP